MLHLAHQLLTGSMRSPWTDHTMRATLSTNHSRLSRHFQDRSQSGSPGSLSLSTVTPPRLARSHAKATAGTRRNTQEEHTARFSFMATPPLLRRIALRVSGTVHRFIGLLAHISSLNKMHSSWLTARFSLLTAVQPASCAVVLCGSQHKQPPSGDGSAQHTSRPALLYAA